MDTLELRTHLIIYTVLLMAFMQPAHAQIDERAPAKTRDSIVIHAPVEKVWQVMADVSRWPQRFDFIRKTQAPSTLREGETFRWNTTRLKLTSRLLTVSSPATLGWEGGRYGVTVRHYWYFQPLPGGQTLVISAESQRGLPVRLFKKSFRQRLREGSEKWLLQLKRTCETSL